MKLVLVFVLSTTVFFAYSQIQYEFGKQKDGNDWVTLKFNGSISFENNGGFASFRNRYGKYNLEDVSTVEIKYRSVGQIMALSLEPNDMFYEPTYRILLEDTNSAWKTVEMDINQFVECVLGEPTGNKITPAILPNIKRIGFINAAKKEGDFEIEIKYLNFK